jgi:hypothetical protein
MTKCEGFGNDEASMSKDREELELEKENAESDFSDVFYQQIEDIANIPSLRRRITDPILFAEYLDRQVELN